MSMPIRLGVLRLVDSAPIIVAQADGLFRDQGIDVRISIEPSWSIVAAKLADGVLDAAVMVPPLAFALCAGLLGPPARLIVPLSLSQGGNAIVTSPLATAGLTDGRSPPRIQLLPWLRLQKPRPRFAVVHTFSTHNLLLRYWFAAAGVDPDRDIETVEIAPEHVVDALAAGTITGFCAGAPWGDVAQRQGVGRILIGTSAIWPFHPEKCLCVGEAWADANPALLQHLLRAVLRAQVSCDRPGAASAIAALLADPQGLRLPQAASRAALPGGSGAESIRFHTRAAWFPARTHALWFLRQMRRWGWLPEPTDLDLLAAQVYRPDLLAPAVDAEGLYPVADLPALEGTATLRLPDHDALLQAAPRSV